MEAKVSCPICRELEDCNLEIPAASLTQSAESGCQLCSILKDGVCKFVEDFDQVEKLQLVVDMSLFVYIVGKNGEKLPVVEFYTLPGE